MNQCKQILHSKVLSSSYHYLIPIHYVPAVKDPKGTWEYLKKHFRTGEINEI